MWQYQLSSAKITEQILFLQIKKIYYYGHSLTGLQPIRTPDLTCTGNLVSKYSKFYKADNFT